MIVRFPYVCWAICLFACMPLVWSGEVEEHKPIKELKLRSFPKGPLPKDLADQVTEIVTAQTKALYPPKGLFVKQVPDEAPLKAVVQGHTFVAIASKSFRATCPEAGVMEIRDFHVEVTEPWVLSDGVTLPVGTLISSVNGKCCVVDRAGEMPKDPQADPAETTEEKRKADPVPKEGSR